MLEMLKVSQITVSLILIFLILIQSKGSGLSYGVKSSISMYRSLRGIERMVFILTIFFGVALVLNSIAIVILS